VTDDGLTDDGLLEDHIAARVSELLGAPLQQHARLDGSDRWIVVRATAGDRSFVVKQARTRRFDFTSGSPHAVRFASERGALEFFAGDDELAARVPHLVAVDEQYGILVMDDLGELPSLADVLLGNDPVQARDRLLEYARLLAVFARRSAARIGEYDASRGHPGHFAIIQLREGIAKLGAPAAVDRQLLEITDHLEAATDWIVVGPGDGCPDNVLVAPHGLCILDFEGAARYHAAFDIGSLAVPFPSCWCHDAFDEELRAALLAAHSAEYGRPGTEYDVAIAHTTIVWSAWTLMRWLEHARLRESEMPFPNLATVRQRVRAAAQAIAENTSGALRAWAGDLDVELGAAWGPTTDARPEYPSLA
jgi:hypothetical protein